MNIEEKRKIEEMYEKGLVEISSIIEPLIENFKIDRCSIDIQQCQLVIDYLIRDRDFDENYIQQLEEELEKEKEKNNRYFKQNIEYQKTLEKLQKETIWKDKIKEIIYPTPENYIPLEVQQSEMYKKLLKEVEE